MIITISINVTIQYLLHFQIRRAFLFYSVILSPKTTKIKEQVPIEVLRREPAGGAVSLNKHITYFWMASELSVFVKNKLMVWSIK